MAVKQSNSMVDNSLFIEMENMSALITESFDSLIQILTSRKQQHLTELSNIKSQYEQYVASKQEVDPSVQSFHKEFEISEIKWRCDPIYANLLSKLGQIDVLLNSKVIPYHIFQDETVVKEGAVQKSKSFNKVEKHISPYYSSVAYYRNNWYVLDSTNCKILVFEKQGNTLIQEIGVTIRGENVKSKFLIIFENSIFTWNRTQKSLLAYTHEGVLIPQIHLPVEIENPSSIAGGQDGYIAIAERSLQLVYLLQPYLNDTHRSIGASNNEPASLVRPKDVCFTKDNFIVVIDCGNPPIHTYNIKGHWISSFGSNQLGQELAFPNNILVTENGFVIVSCSDGFLRVYDPKTTIGYRIGRAGSMSKESGQFCFPTNSAYSEDGHFGVCDYENHRVQFFNLTNIVLKYFFD